MDIVTGVIQTNHAEYLYEDALQGINTTCEKCKSKHIADGEPDEEQPNCDSCGIDEYKYLIGFKEVDGEFVIDEETEYSAIVNTGPFYTTQVVRSKYIAQCKRCSPCYPGQGDLDTPGTDHWAYCIPAELFGEFDEFDVSRIKKVEEERS